MSATSPIPAPVPALSTPLLSPVDQQQHSDRAAMISAAAAVEAVQGIAGIGHVDYGMGEGEEEDIPGLGDKRTKRGFSKRVTLRDLERYFEYPIEEVSRMMGVSTTIIKRLCRKYGIKRWPYRQVSRVTRPLQNLECALSFRRRGGFIHLWETRHRRQLLVKAKANYYY